MIHRVFVGALGAAAIVAALGAGPAAAEPTVVKIGSFTPPKAKYLREILIPWLRKVEADSAGTLKFQEFWGGSLIRSPRKQWEGLNNGIQDASQIIPAYTSKLFPDFTFFSLLSPPNADQEMEVKLQEDHELDQDQRKQSIEGDIDQPG